MIDHIACQMGLLLFLGATLAAVISDIRHMRISNELIIILLVGYLFLMPMCGYEWSTIANDGLVAICVLGVAFIIYMTGGIGAGDAKLMGVTALWLGEDLVLPYILYAAALGGVLAIFFVVIRSVRLPSSLAGKDWVIRLHTKGAHMPYGVALGSAGLLLIQHSHWAGNTFF